MIQVGLRAAERSTPAGAALDGMLADIVIEEIGKLEEDGVIMPTWWSDNGQFTLAQLDALLEIVLQQLRR